MPGEFLEQGDIQLRVNGEVKQSGNINQMIWKLPEIVSRLSELFPLYPGDLIFTGTPAGVGPIKPGDKLRATAGNMELDVEVR
jgi:fumarylpyruvate hydrolase